MIAWLLLACGAATALGCASAWQAAGGASPLALGLGMASAVLLIVGGTMVEFGEG